jgi:HK97 gp10 family phage protein
MKVEFKMSGLDEIQKALEQKGKEARLAVRIALSAGAGDIKKAMAEDAPVEAEGENSGFLAKHINVKTTVKSNNIEGRAFVGPSTAVYPGRSGKRGRVTFKTATGRVISFLSDHAGQVTAARVARFLEFGTRHASAHPWMTKAWMRSRDAALQHMIKKFRETLKLG